MTGTVTAAWNALSDNIWRMGFMGQFNGDIEDHLILIATVGHMWLVYCHCTWTISTTTGPDSIHDILAHSRPFQELPVHAMTKAAGFCVYRSSTKEWDPHPALQCNSNLCPVVPFFGRIFSRFSRNFSFSISLLPPRLCWERNMCMPLNPVLTRRCI